MTPQDRIRAAATVILHRRGDAGPETFLVKRNKALRFFPGYHAFPGGTLDKDERDGGVDDAAFRAAASRELAEEVGVEVAPDALVAAARILTPPFGPLRYDTRFFLAALPDGAEARIVDTGELDSGAWWTPRAALDAFARGEALIPPPTLAFLRALCDEDDWPAAATRLVGEDERPHHERFNIELHPDLHALPLRTPTLPPATTTVTYFVAADDALVVVDPGTPHADEQDVLATVTKRLLDEGRAPRAVVLTHHHGDHIGAAALLKERFGFRVFAHAETAKRVADGLVDETVSDGDAIDLGTHAPTGLAWRLELLHTPGHAPGHLVVRDSRFGAVIAGDLVSSVSTILVDPDEGDMGAYLASLRRVVALKPSVVLPAHGPAVPGATLVARTLAHREDRQARVQEALLGGAVVTLEALAKAAYADTPTAPLPLAMRQAESIVAMLVKEGKAVPAGDDAWRAAP